MKVLQVNVVYREGSTGKITADIHEELLKQGVESVVCYGRGKVLDEPHVYKTCGELYSKINNAITRITGVMYGGLSLSTQKLISIIEKEKPDVVHLQCINGYFVNVYKLITWLKDHRIKTVITLHAEFMYTANCGHAMECDKWLTGCGNCPRRKQETRSLWRDGTAESWKKMRNAFEGFERDCIIVSVSPWLMERAKQSPILADFQHKTVFNGVNTKIFCPCDNTELRRQWNLKDEKIVFHATAYFSDAADDPKGGRYVLQLAERMKHLPVKFFVASNRSVEVDVPKNVVLLGAIADQQKLAQYYSMADVTLLTSKKETFSMVAAESICCGTPLVGMKAGGPETIALPEHSVFVDQGDVDGLETAVCRLLQENKNSEKVAADAANVYSSEMMCKDFLNVYEYLLKMQ